MKDKSSASYLRFTWLALCSSLLLLCTPTFAATKLPVLDVDKGFLVSDTSEIVGFTKLGENWIIAGVDGQERSWISLVNQKGSELWRSFPIDLGKGGEGFLTAVAVDSQRILVAGVAQNELTLSGEPIPEV